MYEVGLRLQGRPAAPVLEQFAMALLVANAIWFANQWAIGCDPPASAEAAGLKHKPLPRSKRPIWRGAPEILHAGDADCLEVAAYDGGYKLAKLCDDGVYKLRIAAGAFRIELVATGGGPKDLLHGDYYWHTVLSTPNGSWDPTERLEKWAA